MLRAKARMNIYKLLQGKKDEASFFERQNNEDEIEAYKRSLENLTNCNRCKWLTKVVNGCCRKCVI